MSPTTTAPDGWIQTYTGARVYPMAPTHTFDIRDIAHSLSNICRFNGHTKFHYSVAQHSYLASTIVERDIALEALLHDAAEHLLGDIPRPIKHSQGMEGFREAEAAAERLIEQQFRLKDDVVTRAKVKAADAVMLATERRDLMRVRPEGEDWLHGATPAEPSVRRIMQWRPEAAERNFLTRYRELVRYHLEDGGW